jgi:hypothetical protein
VLIPSLTTPAFVADGTGSQRGRTIFRFKASRTGVLGAATAFRRGTPAEAKGDFGDQIQFRHPEKRFRTRLVPGNSSTVPPTPAAPGRHLQDAAALPVPAHPCPPVN